MEHTKYENVLGKVLIYWTKGQIFSYLRSKNCIVNIDENFMKGGHNSYLRKAKPHFNDKNNL